MKTEVPFNRLWTTGREVGYITEAIDAAHTSAFGPFTARVESWLAEHQETVAAFLTNSGTGALELSALLAGVGPGDEVVMPSFTFPATATAFALRGAVPVFVDVRPDTLVIDATLVAGSITPRTRAVVPMHYGGIAVDMDPLLELARDHELIVIEDAAHAVSCTYRGRPLGSLGDMGALSFHETKNVTCGEGGALLVRHERLVARAEVLLARGTDRLSFLRGEVDHYSWRDLGSAFAASDVSAAFLWAQLQAVEDITNMRRQVWNAYHHAFAELEADGRVRRPVVPGGCVHNAHLYYLLVPSGRARFLGELAARGVQAVFHYTPLHLSEAGLRYGRPHGDLSVTERVSAQLVRLPLWAGMTDQDVRQVITAVHESLGVAPASDSFRDSDVD